VAEAAGVLELQPVSITAAAKSTAIVTTEIFLIIILIPP